MIARHRVVVAQATSLAWKKWSVTIVPCLGALLPSGLNVDSMYGPIAVHCDVLGQLTPSSGEPPSIRTGVGVPGFAGANAIARPTASTATHEVVVGQLIAVSPSV